MITLHELPKTHGRRSRRVGRGNASNGSYSGRGIKGQRARSGGRNGLYLRGLKQSMLRVPKLRGFHSLRSPFQPVNIGDLEKAFAENATIKTQDLIKAGLVRVLAPVKILGNGNLQKPLHVHVHAASVKARKAIEDAGGSLTIVRTRLIS